MRRTGALKDAFLSFENIYSAYKKAYRGKKSSSVFMFSFNLEKEIFLLKKELETGLYNPEPYRYFTIYVPKERIISVAAFRDRVVHHALVNILEPLFEKVFISDSYATRKYKGTHKAVLKAQTFLKKNNWYLKMDIRKYFASIDHKILVSIIGRKIKDKFILDLCWRIIECAGEKGRGLPIGNLTSQFFANVYLNYFDHFIKNRCRIKYYLRYMDDFCIFLIIPVKNATDSGRNLPPDCIKNKLL